MAFQPETATYEVGVYQIEIADPVQGGVGGLSNTPLLHLANRTKYLKQHIDAIESGAFLPPGFAPLNSPAFTGTPTAPTPPDGDSSTKIATTAFAQRLKSGVAVVNVAGGANVTLTQPQWGLGIIQLTGAITANLNVVFPVNGQWIVINSTTGAFTITCKTAAGAGVVVAQGKSALVFGDGTDIKTDDNYPLASTAARGIVQLATAAEATAGTDASKAVTPATLAAALGIASGGFVNKLRNAPLDVWMRGTAGASIPAGTTVYTADGWQVGPTGAAATWARDNGRARTKNSLKITGATGLTALTITKRVESIFAQDFTNQTTIYQAWVYNGTGAAFTPTLGVARANAVDDFSAVTAEGAAVNLQLCPDAAWTLVSATFPVGPNAANGVQAQLNFGNALNGAGKFVRVCEADWRIGTLLLPAELRPITAEQLLCFRYLPALVGSGARPLPIIGTWQDTIQGNMIWVYQVPTRVAPASPTLALSAVGDFQIQYNGAFRNATSLSIVTVGTQAMEIAFSTAGTATAGANAWLASIGPAGTSGGPYSILLLGSEL